MEREKKSKIKEKRERKIVSYLLENSEVPLGSHLGLAVFTNEPISKTEPELENTPSFVQCIFYGF